MSQNWFSALEEKWNAYYPRKCSEIVIIVTATGWAFIKANAQNLPVRRSVNPSDADTNKSTDSDWESETESPKRCH